MAMKLYSHPFSQHARKVRVVALELGVELELVDIALDKGAARSPEFLARNPNGKVPVLEHDGWYLWESNAIISYLADLAPGGTKLYPEDRRLRADVNRWLHWEAAHFAPAALAITWERFVKPTFANGKPDPALLAKGEADLARFATVLNGHLEGGTYVANRQYSLADVALAAQLMYRQSAGIDLAPYRHVQAWLDRVESRDAWKKTSIKM